MKRFLLFAVAALAFVGCNTAFEDEGNARFEQNTLPTLTAGFEDATRTYVEQDTYLRWHADDRLTIFYGNTLNHQYKFLGKTGATGGEFEPVKSGNLGTGNSFDHIYAVYPYDANISLDDIEKSMSLSLPAEQKYSEDSFGRGANTMVAVTENLEDTFLAFKNACGYLKVKLYSNVATVVKSITISGNNGEKIAGAATVTMAYGETPQLSMATGSVGSITLDCGSGVMLSSDAEKPTEFWFVVPPTTFTKGITIVATDSYDAVFVKSTSNKVVVSRNEIQPMAALEAIFPDPTPAYNEIWYTSSDGKTVEPPKTNVFGANIVSNTYKDGKGVITFDGDVTTIGNQAFYNCDSLTSVTIGDSVTTIGYAAFSSCDSLKEFKGKFASDNGRCLIVDGVLNSFAIGCGATEYTIPDSVTTIGEEAFYGCTSLTSVTIPDSVTTIGDFAFFFCTSLTSVTIGDRVTTIGDAAFWNCESLTSVTIPDSVTTIGNHAFEDCDSLTSVTIPDSVTTIGDAAFWNCYSLTSVTIPDSVTTIGDQAFRDCDSLTSVTIPDSVTTIGEKAFYDCDSLTSVTIGDSVTTIGRSAFESCESLTSVTIGDSVTTIGDEAFYWCPSLTSVIIPDSVTTIGNSAFYDCDSLTSVTIGDSVTTIGEWAFVDCDSLTSVTIGDSVTKIGDYAFYWCNSLTSVTIPDSVTKIGDNAFDGCAGLKEVYCKATTPPTMGGSVFGDTDLESIYVPTASVDAYKDNDGWIRYSDIIFGYDF